MINKNWESKSYLKKQKYWNFENKFNLTITIHTTYVQIYINNF